MKYHFITIEGNIGAGKTTLAHMLARHFNARLILEQFADNPFLPKFYENPAQYAFPLELFFMAERYKQLKELVHTADLFQSVTISDYLFSKCLLFARVNLPDQEFLLPPVVAPIRHHNNARLRDWKFQNQQSCKLLAERGLPVNDCLIINYFDTLFSFRLDI